MTRYPILHCCVLFAAVVLMSADSNTVRGETLLFSDNYNVVPESTNINTGIGPGRTDGTYALSTYTTYTAKSGVMTVGDTDGTNPNLALSFMTGDTFAWIDHDFNGADSAGGLEVVMTARVSSTTYWWGISVGGSSADASELADRPLAKGVFVRFESPSTGSCPVVVRENGVDYLNVTWLAARDTNYHSFKFQINGVGDSNPFDNTGALNIKLYVDGGATPVFDYTTKATAWEHNYIGFDRGSGATAYLDNLVVTRIPEPSTLALLACGLVGLLAYAWRKRK